MSTGELGGEAPPLRAATTRFGGFGVGLSLVVTVALVVTQPTWSPAVLLPLCLLGVSLAILLGRAAVARARPLEPATFAASGAPGSIEAEDTASPPADRYDDVDHLAALRHEFRTPLNAVLGFSDVLLRGIDGDVNDSQREDLEIIRASGMKLQVLLDSALDLSQLALGGLKLDLDSTNANDVVSRAADEAGQLWAGKRSALSEVPQAPCVATIDAVRLRRCLLVLADVLGNQYREAKIHLELAPTEEHLVVTVSADPSGVLALDALPTPAEVVGAEDPMKIRRWPVAVSTEIVAAHQGSLYHGDEPARFVIRVPRGEGA